MGKETYITLKEASECSGYTPDYVGQLIRSGKIPGKQVYSNVQWVTTKEAVTEYIAMSKGKKQPTSDVSRFGEFPVKVLQEKTLSQIYSATLYALIFFGVTFSLFLFYVLSVNLEKKLQVKASQRAAAVEVVEIPLPRTESGELLQPL